MSEGKKKRARSVDDGLARLQTPVHLPLWEAVLGADFFSSIASLSPASGRGLIDVSMLQDLTSDSFDGNLLVDSFMHVTDFMLDSSSRCLCMLCSDYCSITRLVTYALVNVWIFL